MQGVSQRLAVGDELERDRIDAVAQPVGFFDFLFGVALVWATVELGVMGGEMGANRFGPNPLRPVSA